MEKTGLSRALCGVLLGTGAEAWACRGGGKEDGWGREDGIALFGHCRGPPKLIPLPCVHLGLSNASKIASRNFRR